MPLSHCKGNNKKCKTYGMVRETVREIAKVAIINPRVKVYWDCRDLLHLGGTESQNETKTATSIPLWKRKLLKHKKTKGPYFPASVWLVAT